MTGATTKETNWRRELLVSYGCMFLWISLSAVVILFNKYLLSYGDFPYPIGLTTIHMGFCSILAYVLVKSGVVQGVDISFDTYLRAIVPIGVLFSVVLWLNNAAYLYLSVSFIQMLKACQPASVFFLTVLFRIETYSHLTALNMAVIGIGVVIASAGEINFVVVGVVIQLIAIVSESVRITLIQILLQKRGIKLNPITTLYYVAPCCFVCLLLPLMLFEMDSMLTSEVSFVPMIPVLLVNASAAFVLNLSVFLLIGKTSALTLNIAGVVKDWLLIGLSVLIFKSPVTPMNLFGYSIAFAGVAWYNYKKIQAAKLKNETEQKAPEKGEEAALAFHEKEADPAIRVEAEETPLLQKSY
ncbi:hypothetical protein BSKO_12026 [Bryopsis sp. KO-2023]|nr:hypothetical protein BSKO_12026 [Bryopsis sp. KO-2023]